jgi:2'-hydroxyisoflavone reductase
MKGGDMLWPGTSDDDIQIIDVRDLANFAVDCAERRTAGIYNTVTPAGAFTMGDMLEDCLAVTAADMTPHWVSTDFLNEQEARFPIWEDPNGEFAALQTVAGERAAAAGLHTRPTRETARDTVTWWKTLPAERTATIKAGPDADREAELLKLWAERS